MVSAVPFLQSVVRMSFDPSILNDLGPRWSTLVIILALIAAVIALVVSWLRERKQPVAIIVAMGGVSVALLCALSTLTIVRW